MTIRFRDKFKTISEAADSAMMSVFRSRGFTNTKIITDWQDIVGEELAMSYTPAKISNSVQGVVTLLLESRTLRDRQYIVYNKSLIIEKINRFLGHQAIHDIRLSAQIRT